VATTHENVPIATAPSADAPSRRGFLAWLAGILAAAGAALAAWPMFRSLVPNVLYEPPKKFRIGLPDNYQEGVTFLEEHRLFLFRDGASFHAISGICTHLGCTVKFAAFGSPKEETVRGYTFRSLGEFRCPCHGSMFRGEGTNFAGPAPRPLTSYLLEVSPVTGDLVVDVAAEVSREFRLVV